MSNIKSKKSINHLDYNKCMQSEYKDVPDAEDDHLIPYVPDAGVKPSDRLKQQSSTKQNNRIWETSRLLFGIHNYCNISFPLFK